MIKKLKQKLIIFEMANNHMGDISHGIKIIKEYSKFIRKYNFQFAFKLQYRDLNTFIHRDFKKRNDLHYVKRFLDTKLSENQFNKLIQVIKKYKFKTISTPFDENSIKLIQKQNLDFIKVASCSFGDWPLLEEIAKTKKPIILSTAGSTIDTIDNVVSFLKNRNKSFSLLHCVAEYPTKSHKLNLSQIEFLKNRYSDVSIGYSSHEYPNNIDNVKIAVAKGAEVFEKHVGLETEKFSLNKYSMNINQTDTWLKSLHDSIKVCGELNRYKIRNNDEILSLRSLQRGVYLKKNIKINSLIKKSDVYFAFPPQKNQILANDYSKYLTLKTKTALKKDSPLLKKQIQIKDNRKKILNIMNKISAFIKKTPIVLPKNTKLEISHHYGLDKFFKYGLSMFTIVNREYCKKILVCLPSQIHPTQYHKIKEETFNVIYGDLKLEINNEIKILGPGDVLTIKPRENHKFSSKKGCIIEEISTTHNKSDSFYIDPKIAKNKNRKTIINFWI